MSNTDDAKKAWEEKLAAESQKPEYREAVRKATAKLSAIQDKPEFKEFMDLLRKWYSLREKAMDVYGLTEEEFDSILSDESALQVMNNVSLAEFVDQSATDENRLLVGGLLDTILQKSREENISFYDAVQAVKEAVEKSGPQAAELPAIIYKHSGTIETSIDKLANIFTGISAAQPDKEIDGQMSFATPERVKYERDGTPEITLTYSYTQNRAALNKYGVNGKITDYDFFVQTALDNLLTNGNSLVSVTQIFKEMHGNRQPNSTQTKKLLDSLRRNLSTIITIDDYEVMKAWHKLDPKKGEKYHVVTGALAPVKIGEEFFTANGKPVQNAIKILDHPPVLQIGKQIGQYTTIPRSLLDNNISKTDRYYRVLHYLITAIARMRSGTRKHKILYSTFYSETGEKTPRNKDLAKKMLWDLLNHFQKCGWIKKAEEEPTPTTGEQGVKIIFDKDVHNQIANNKKTRKKLK